MTELLLRYMPFWYNLKCAIHPDHAGKTSISISHSYRKLWVKELILFLYTTETLFGAMLHAEIS